MCCYNIIQQVTEIQVYYTYDRQFKGRSKSKSINNLVAYNLFSCYRSSSTVARVLKWGGGALFQNCGPFMHESQNEDLYM